jgi:hypothetical protein
MKPEYNDVLCYYCEKISKCKSKKKEKVTEDKGCDDFKAKNIWGA